MPADVRVAPHIYRTPHGWRVYLRVNGVLKPVRFKRDVTLAQLEAYVAGAKAEADTQREARRRAIAAAGGTFASDVRRYLALKVVQAMPSYTDRARDLGYWVAAFGARPRASLTTRQIDEQLQAWRDAGAAASTVNNRRTALMSLFTRLDGRSAANPVRGAIVFEEPAAEPRGVSYRLIRALLDAMPRDQSRPIKGVKGSGARGSLSRVRFELMAWTGMTPAQIKQLRPRHINLRERWYISPPRRKGRRPRHPRPEIKKPMTTDALEAFRRFVKLKAWGDFSTSSLRHVLERARRRLERQLQRTTPNAHLPKVRPYDFRHSFGTELFRRTGNLPLVSEMLDHSSLRMTHRYALGAVSEVLKGGMQKFERAAGRRRRR